MPNIYPFKQYGEYQSFYPYYLPSYYGNYYPRSFEKYYYEPRMTMNVSTKTPKITKTNNFLYILVIVLMIYLVFRYTSKK